MASTFSIAQSGMQVAQQQLQIAAHNIANSQTTGFHRQQLVQETVEGGGVQGRVERASSEGPDLVADVIGQLSAKNSFLANLAVFRTADKMLGTLLNEKV